MTKTMFLSIDGDKFMLNGGEARLKGVNYSDPDSPWLWSRQWNPDAARLGLSAAQKLGINSVRIWIPNSFEEVSSDGPDALTLITQFLDLAGEYGIRCYIGLRWKHKWTTAGSIDDKKNLGYLGLLLDMLKNDPRVLAYDLMNEADHINDQHWQWNMNPVQAMQRLNWLRRMYETIKEADPNHPVSSGSTFSYSYWTPCKPYSLESFMDFIDFHYYRSNYRESTLAQTIRSVKEHTDRPIIIGEFGFSSCPEYSALGEPEHSNELQAQAFEDYLSDCESEGVAGVMPWVLTDYTQEFESGESEFGLLRADYVPKPVAEVYASKFQVEKLW